MRFALLGDHPDGLDFARALADSGRHEIVAYAGPVEGSERLARWNLHPKRIGDVEEILADPAVEAVIVADKLSARPAQIRRALQSERHVATVMPPAASPNPGYEAGALQGDVGVLLLPLLTEQFHPGIRRFADLARMWTEQRLLKLIEIERSSTDAILLEAEDEAQLAGLPGWDSLRLIGGDFAEVMTIAGTEEWTRESPILMTGQFLTGCLFQQTLLPFQAENRYRLSLVLPSGRAELSFPQGYPGPARLTYPDLEGHATHQEWDAINPWTALVDFFDAKLAGTPNMPTWNWLQAQRALELDDAAKRSVYRRRSSTLEYQEATEEASFKGTMTLFGCSLLWISLMLLIASIWVPRLGWLILPVFGLFLAMQVFRWAIPPR